MRTSTCLALVLVFLAGACFDVPLLAPRDAGTRDVPVPRAPLPFAVGEVHARDVSGRSWPLDAAPRRLVIEVELTAPLAEDADSIVLVRGEPDEALRADLARRPLTVATRERSVTTEVRREATRVSIAPEASLAPGDVLTLGIASYASSVDGDLLGDATLVRVQISTAPEAGARVVASFPADGTVDVPPNAEPFALALDGDVVVTGEPIALRWRTQSLETVTTIGRCSPLGLEASQCLRVAPRGTLPTGAQLVLETTPELRDATGASVAPFSLQITTALEVDVRPPALVTPISCAIDARSSWGCVLETEWSWRLDLTADEPVRIELSRLGVVTRSLAPRGTTSLVIDALSASTREPATLVLIDLGGLRTTLPIEVTTLETLSPLTITEVCANPVGAEPDQEWVELTNVGDVPASLSGVSISDREDALGSSLTTERTLVPGARVLLVGEGFDADAAGVPAGTPLVVAGRTIVTSGIANAGEALFLRDAQVHRLARVPSMSGREGECLVRNHDANARADAIGDFHYDACTPGR